ncbi:MAG: dTMP kinase [Rikenellaceae bacterium]
MLIVLEGLDGAGKSTQIELLRNMFREMGVESEYLHFPRFDAPIYGDLIARFLRGELGALSEVNPYLVALLYAGDRADAAAMLRGWMESGKVVILDRYVYSNVGYQCGKIADEEGRKELSQWILDLEYNHFGIPRPDISFFLDVPFAFTKRKLEEQRDGADRDYLQGKKDIHESSLDLQQQVRQVYLSAAEIDETLNIINCSSESGAMETPQNIFAKIQEALLPTLQK